jgi:putative flippase GtrA
VQLSGNISFRGPVLRFVLASGVSFGISFGTPIFLHEILAIPPPVAVALTLTLILFLNFFVAKYFIYRSSGSIRSEFLSYIGVSVGFRIAEYAGFALLYLALGFKYYVANLLVVSASFPIKFFAYQFAVYSSRPVPQDLQRSPIP